MAFWDIYSGNSVWIMNIFRALILIFAIFEIYMYSRKREDLEELMSWRSKPLQEARGNLLMIGLFIIVFGVIIYLDSYSDQKFLYIPMDIALLLLIESLYFLPKRAIIATTGIYYGGSFTPSGQILDYTVHNRFDRLIVKGPRSLFSSNTEVPLPEDKRAMEKSLEEMLGTGGKKKADKGRKKDTEGSKGSKTKGKDRKQKKQSNRSAKATKVRE